MIIVEKNSYKVTITTVLLIIVIGGNDNNNDNDTYAQLVKRKKNPSRTRGLVVKASDPRSRGLVFDSRRPVMCKNLGQAFSNTAFVT